MHRPAAYFQTLPSTTDRAFTERSWREQSDLATCASTATLRCCCYAAGTVVRISTLPHGQFHVTERVSSGNFDHPLASYDPPSPAVGMFHVVSAAANFVHLGCIVCIMSFWSWMCSGAYIFMHALHIAYAPLWHMMLGVASVRTSNKNCLQPGL